ncbi:MAG: hypothetical protein IPG99_13100 [Ignavibacteria bacterium]|nr:hypothetical protein [Ignavibacteria bacterium]
MGDAKRAVLLLTSEDKDTINEYAKVLQGVNEERREVDKNITDDALRCSRSRMTLRMETPL